MAANHGNTPAAWTAVIIVFIGFVVGGAGVLFGRAVPGLALGAAIVVAGAAVGKVMQLMGLGVAASRD
jgi:hypothetical protein